MAVTISGAQFHLGAHDSVSGGSSAGAGNLSLSSVSEHTTVSGGASGAGFDTVNSPGSSGEVSGGASAPSDVVATQGQEGGNVVVHLSDGSSITVVGTNHIDATFSH